jgi:hypothetical protein
MGEGVKVEGRVGMTVTGGRWDEEWLVWGGRGFCKRNCQQVCAVVGSRRNCIGWIEAGECLSRTPCRDDANTQAMALDSMAFYASKQAQHFLFALHGSKAALSSGTRGWDCAVPVRLTCCPCDAAVLVTLEDGLDLAGQPAQYETQQHTSTETLNANNLDGQHPTSA